METADLIIVGKQVLIDQSIVPAAIYIKEGKVSSIQTNQDVADASNVMRVPETCVLLPGVVDSHVHVNEPGRTEWEGFWSATQAAAKGGVTTIADMPLNSIPPTTTVENFNKKLDAAKGQCHVDVGFIGGLVQENSNTQELKSLLSEGVVGFKCFLIDSGVAEFTWVNESQLRSGLEQLRGTGSFLMFHAELALDDQKEEQSADPKQYDTFLHSRPKEMENKAIELVIKVCREFNVRCHIVHLSSSEALDIIREAKKEGVALTVETCYHYLFFDSEEIPDAQPRFKCCPPIREKENRSKLWEALGDGTIDLVVSDHSPCTADLKAKNGGSFMDSWGGISSVQFGLSILYTEAVKRGFGFVEISKWLSQNPAKLLGIEKGKIQVGYDADFCIFDPTTKWVVKATEVLHKNKLTAYEGKELQGTVVKTILRGNVIYENGVFAKPSGKFVLRKK